MYSRRSWPIMRMISQRGWPGSSREAWAKRRSRVMSMGEMSLVRMEGAISSHLAVLNGPRQSNHSAGSSQSQNCRASS